MKHIDEGTIHAWLDGALSAAEAREVSEHTAACAECGALVAEARGFIAGASRILSSLDDVPGVVPERAPVVAQTKPAQRFWQASPWVTGIAAVAILAIGLREWQERPSAKAAFAPVPPAMDSLRALELPQAKRVDSALRTDERRALRPVSAPSATVPPKVQLRGTSAVAAASGAGARAADIAGDAPRPLSDLAKKDAVAAVAEVASSASKEVSLAGCYQLGPALALERNVLGASANAAAASRDIVARQRAAQAAPSAPAASPAGAAGFATPEQVVPTVVRLDTTVLTRGRAVTSPLSGAALGVWELGVGDSIRVMLPAVGTRTIATSSRIACPTP